MVQQRAAKHVPGMYGSSKKNGEETKKNHRKPDRTPVRARTNITDQTYGAEEVHTYVLETKTPPPLLLIPTPASMAVLVSYVHRTTYLDLTL